MTTAARWIDYLPLSDLVRAEWNPKLHHPDIGTSLDRFGYVESITMDERTGRLVAGHGRLDQLVAKHDAGEPPPEGVDVRDDGEWLIPVQRGWSSVDDDEARAYLVASNELTTAGGWDTASLEQGLAEMRDRKVDLAGLGLDLATMTGTHTVAEHERKDPEPREPARTCSSASAPATSGRWARTASCAATHATTDAAFEYAPDNPKSETGFFSNRGRPDLAHVGMARPSNVLRIGAETGLTGLHSAPFPLALPAWFIRAYTDEGDRVYDPFMGSGSTLLAAEQHQRIGYGMELSPGYCDVILDRWERHGGTTSVLAVDG